MVPGAPALIYSRNRTVHAKGRANAALMPNTMTWLPALPLTPPTTAHSRQQCGLTAPPQTREIRDASRAASVP